jgi:hypothetical protein
MRGQESVEDALIRWQMLEMVQEHYRDFIPFLEDVMTLLGFSTTDIQRDIAGFIAYGPQHLMVMAQRGQAKTTIVAAYAVWALIHNPHYRILVISAGGAQANDIAVLIIRIIMNMSQLECMRPDKLAGDRTSTENFDLHHSIKGVDKSASIACMGIGANLQGRRADILIPDDVESSKNSTTPTERAKLSHLVKDFPSIANAAWARILWMGTPQSMESIYNGLAAKGCTIRIWPGRYPTPAQREHYGDKLAPLLTQRLARDPSLGSGGGQLGDQGQATDPILRGEEALQHVELIQDTAYFQLQHMLNTAMSDAMRHPLKTERLVMAAYGAQMPLEFVRGPDSSYLTDKIVGDFSFRVSTALHWSKECAPMQSVWAYVDPAAGGANADETAYAVAGFLNGNIYLLEVGGLPGGYDEFKLTELAGICIEKNMGHGAFRAVFEPYARKVLPGVPLSDDLVTGQKEMRIINILAPIIGRGSLAVCDQVFEQDAADIAKYSPNVRLTYSFFYQLAHLSAARNALVHDDRLDAVAGVCNLFVEALAQDQSKKVALLKAKEWEESIKDPLGKNRYGSVKDARPQTLLQRRGQGLLQRRANSRSR